MSPTIYRLGVGGAGHVRSLSANISGSGSAAAAVAGTSAVGDYAIDRPAISGALLWGWDGQGYSAQADIQNGEAGNFRVGANGGDASQTLLKISGVEQAEFCAHFETGVPVFGNAIRQYCFDGSDYSGLTPSNVEWSVSFSGAPRVFIRICFRATETWDTRTHDAYGGADALKLPWTTRARHGEFTGPAWQPRHQWRVTSPGGSEEQIPGSPWGSSRIFNSNLDVSRGFKPWAQGSGVAYADMEWYEFIIFDGFWPDDDLYQKALWLRKISSGGVLQAPEQVLQDPTTDGAGNSWPGGVPAKFGSQFTGATGSCVDVSSVTFPKNKNSHYNDGDVDWYWRGPMEVIDADVVADPFGLAGDAMYDNLNL